MNRSDLEDWSTSQGKKGTSLHFSPKGGKETLRIRTRFRQHSHYMIILIITRAVHTARKEEEVLAAPVLY